jgi:hypothetical protein
MEGDEKNLNSKSDMNGGIDFFQMDARPVSEIFKKMTLPGYIVKKIRS